MRISDSQLSGYVTHHSQQSLTEVEETTKAHTQVTLGPDQRVVLKHESINLVDSQFFESEKSDRLYTKSTITNSDANEQITITQEELTNSLVSGVLEKSVHIGDLVYQSGSSAELSFGASLGIDMSVEGSTAGVADQTASTTEINISEQDVLAREDAMTLVSEGEISTDDGRTINFRLELDLDSRYFERSERSLNIRSEDLIDPLVISLDGSAPTLRNSTFTFDIDSDGEADRLASLSSGAGFLALDKNNDGVINNGQELFGPQSGNGYADLAEFDENGDGWIDENDDIFNQLSVWQPGEGGGEDGEEGSLISIAEAGVGAISLQALESPFEITDEHNNTLGMVQRSGVYLREDGQVGLIQQIDLAVQAPADDDSANDDLQAQASELEQSLKQHLATNHEQLFASRALDFDVISVEQSAEPIFVIARQFQIVELQQQNVAQQLDAVQQRNVVKQHSSFKETVVEPVMAEQETVEEQVAQVISSARDVPLFSGVSGSRDAHVGIQLNEEKHSVLNGLIEDVLRPLQEQLKLKREKASEEYKLGS